MRLISKLLKKKILSKLAICGKNVYIEKPIKIQYEYVEIGNDSHILKDARIQNVSDDKNTRIRIGERTGIGYLFRFLLVQM